MPIRFTHYDPRTDRNGIRQNPYGMDRDYVNARNVAYTRSQQATDSLYDPRLRNTHINRIKNALRPLWGGNVAQAPVDASPVENRTATTPILTNPPVNPTQPSTTPTNINTRNRRNQNTNQAQTNQANPTPATTRGQNIPPQTVTPPNPTALPNPSISNPSTVGRTRNRNRNRNQNQNANTTNSVNANQSISNPTIIGTPNTAYTNGNPNIGQTGSTTTSTGNIQPPVNNRNAPPTTYSNASPIATYDEIDAQNITPVNETQKFSLRNLGRAIRNKPLEGEAGVNWDQRFKNNPKLMRERLEIKNQAIVAEQKKKTLVAQEEARREYEEKIHEINDSKEVNREELEEKVKTINESGPTEKQFKKQALKVHNTLMKNDAQYQAENSSLTKKEKKELISAHETELKDADKERKQTEIKKVVGEAENKNQYLDAKKTSAFSEFKDKSDTAEKQLKATLDGVNVNREQLKLEQTLYKETVANNKREDVMREVEQAEKDGDTQKAALLREELDAKEKADKEADRKSGRGGNGDGNGGGGRGGRNGSDGESYEERRRRSHLNVVNEATKAYLLNDLFRDIQTLGRSKTGDEAMAAGGGAVANVVGYVGSAISGLPIVGQLGKAIVDTVMIPVMRNREEVERLSVGAYKTQATTGRDMRYDSIAAYGYSRSDVAEQMQSTARAAGTSLNAEKNTSNTLKLERGFGIDRSVVNDVLSLRQSIDPLKQIGGMYSRSIGEGDKKIFEETTTKNAKGETVKNVDRTFLNEFTQKMTQLQRQLLETNSSVKGGVMTDQVNLLSQISPMLNIRDPRGMQNIGKINEGLVSPTNDYTQAYSYGVLRRAMPGASLTDVKIEQQKGLNSDKYLKGVLGGLQGDRDTQVQQIQTYFRLENNAELADKIYKNKDKYLNGEIGKDELTNNRLENQELNNEAQKNTTFNQRTAADIRDAFVQGGLQGMSTLAVHLVDAFKGAMAGAKVEIGDDATMHLGGVKHNQPKAANASEAFWKVVDPIIPDGAIKTKMKEHF